MPILPREPDLLPEELFDGFYRPESGERLWWVMHTRPRQDKSLARELWRRRIPFYLPQIARRSPRGLNKPGPSQIAKLRFMRNWHTIEDSP